MADRGPMDAPHRAEGLLVPDSGRAPSPPLLNSRAS